MNERGRTRSPAGGRSKQLAHLRRLRLKGWIRPISPTMYAHGVSACLENARSLLDEAHLLMDAQHHARAVALAILALEEGDKPRQLMLLAMGEETAKKQWEAFRLHAPKLAASLSLLTHGRYSLLQTRWGALKPKKSSSFLNADLPHLAERLKERCLYADLLTDGVWAVPNRTIPAVLSEALVETVCLQLMMTTTLALVAGRVVNGQATEWTGEVHVDLDTASPRAKRWLRWMNGKAGRAWSEKEWARHTCWIEASSAGMTSRLCQYRTRP